MKKIISVILVLCMCLGVVSLTGCSKKEEPSDIRIAVFSTVMDGTPINDYPNRILTDTKILEIIDSSTGTEPLPADGPIGVLFELVYINDLDEEISVLIQNTGKVTYMSLGLPQAVHCLTQEELDNVISLIVGAEEE